MIIKNNFLFIFLLSISAFAQKTKKKDTARIVSYVNKIIIKVNMDTQTDGIPFLTILMTLIFTYNQMMNYD